MSLSQILTAIIHLWKTALAKIVIGTTVTTAGLTMLHTSTTIQHHLLPIVPNMMSVTPGLHPLEDNGSLQGMIMSVIRCHHNKAPRV